MGKNKIKVWCDEDVDILYISLRRGVSIHSEEIEKSVRIEYDDKGQVIGVEITEITRMLAKPIARRLAYAMR